MIYTNLGGQVIVLLVYVKDVILYIHFMYILYCILV